MSHLYHGVAQFYILWYRIRMNDCIFCKIAHHEIDSKLLYEDDKVVAFNDIHPQMPTHILIIPKKHIKEFYILTNEDDDILIAIKNTIIKLISERNLHTAGYKIEVNGGGRQDIDHLHFHLMSQASQTQ